MSELMRYFILITAFISAGICGYMLYQSFISFKRSRSYKETIVKVDKQDTSLSLDGTKKRYKAFDVETFMETQTNLIRLGKSHFPIIPISASKASIESELNLSGLSSRVSFEGYRLTQEKASLIFALSGLFIGLLFSTQLGILLGICGLVFGWVFPRKRIKNLIDTRSLQMEKHLPEMLDVVALGMRSGLSFDASVNLYIQHFGTALSGELKNAQKRWTSGLESRDEALRKIASTYNSPVFSRVVETIIRSLRFGSSMVSSLEAQSETARIAYKTQREEQVAKAPVKMMIPTGTLILPAMLILVLGPVLLELIGGGF